MQGQVNHLVAAHQGGAVLWLPAQGSEGPLPLRAGCGHLQRRAIRAVWVLGWHPQVVEPEQRQHHLPLRWPHQGCALGSLFSRQQTGAGDDLLSRTMIFWCSMPAAGEDRTACCGLGAVWDSGSACRMHVSLPCPWLCSHVPTCVYHRILYAVPPCQLAAVHSWRWA